MWRIAFARVDDRLIHGQVMVKWIRSTDAHVIVVMDDVLGVDKFMQNIYRMAAPPGIEVKIMDIKTASEEWKKGVNEEKVFLICKSISVVKQALEAGIPIKELNIGGLEKKPKSDGRQFVTGIYLDHNDVQMLLEFQERWKLKIFVQMIPDYERLEFSRDFKKYFPSLN